MNNRHTKQLKKHILAVSTCKIHRLKTNSTSVTALSMGRCPYPGSSVFMEKGRTLCVCIVCVYVCRYCQLYLWADFGTLFARNT